MKQHRQIQVLEASVTRSENQDNSKQLKASKMMFMILAWLLILWSPFSILHLVSSVGYPVKDQGTVYKVVYVLTVYMLYINSFINPLVYAYQSSEFRKAYKQILGRHSSVT